MGCHLVFGCPGDMELLCDVVGSRDLLHPELLREEMFSTTRPVLWLGVATHLEKFTCTKNKSRRQTMEVLLIRIVQKLQGPP
jgi:hypothetical protein